MEGDDGTVALRSDLHQESLAVPPEPGALAGGPEPDGVGQPARRSRPPRFYLLAAAALAALGCLDTLAQFPLWRQAPALATANLVMSLAFILTGLLLRQERGQRGVAWALILAGVFRSLDFIDAWNTGPWPVYAVVFGGIDRVFGAYAVLRYPRPALGRLERIFVLTVTGWMVLSRSLVVVTTTATSAGYPASSWWPTITANERLSGILAVIQDAGDGVVVVVLVVLLVRRLVETRGLDRIVIAPVIAAGLAAAAATVVSAVAQAFSTISVGPTGAYVAESVVDVLLPVAFLVAVIQRGLLARNLTGLSAQVAAGADLGQIRHALRETLHDPTLEVLPPTALPPTARPGPRADSRLVEVIRTDAGTPIAVVIADAALARYRGLFDAAVRTSGLALRNAQLQAEAARAELDSVRASRARIVAAALAERRRLERDLHDGAQQRLLGLAARLTVAMSRTSDPEATAAFAGARTELGQVLAELRDLAHGIHPATLVQGGLAAALEEVAERLPLAIDLDVAPGRGPAEVEAAAYFAACEALTNTVKHAGASQASVVVRMTASHLEMEVTDDGAGGADPAGNGLANLMDRVGAVDGEAVIDSPPARGTRLWVRIPCG
ncbi:MAG: histidine kinase [Streptosporangiaceae bacterium]